MRTARLGRRRGWEAGAPAPRPTGRGPPRRRGPKIAAHIQGIGWINVQAQGGPLAPLIAFTLGQRVQLAGEQFEGAQILVLGVDFQQFQAHRVALGMGAQCFLENFLSLRIAAVSDVDVSFGHRIDFIGIQMAGGGAETGIKDTVVGIDALATGRAEQRICLQAGIGQGAVGK